MKRFPLILLLLIHGILTAADWPQWRGPNRDGVWTDSGIASSFPSGGLVPKWKAPIGFGYSSPILLNGMLYLSDLVADKPIAHERMLCFNARSGKRIWMTQHDTSPPDWFFSPAQLRGPGSTPLIHNGRIYGLSMFPYSNASMPARELYFGNRILWWNTNSLRAPWTPHRWSMANC